jgi:hypothetical protein
MSTPQINFLQPLEASPSPSPFPSPAGDGDVVDLPPVGVDTGAGDLEGDLIDIQDHAAAPAPYDAYGYGYTPPSPPALPIPAPIGQGPGADGFNRSPGHVRSPVLAR